MVSNTSNLRRIEEELPEWLKRDVSFLEAREVIEAAELLRHLNKNKILEKLKIQ